MSFQHITVNCLEFEADLRSARQRIAFVDDHQRLGYFVPVNCESDLEVKAPYRFDGNKRSCYGGLTTLTELWSHDDQDFLGVFVPESEIDEPRYQNFQRQFSLETLKQVEAKHFASQVQNEIAQTVGS